MEIPIANNFNELAEMDFADYGDRAAYLHIRDTFPRFSAITLNGDKKKEEQTAEMAKEMRLRGWIGFFWGAGNSDGG